MESTQSFSELRQQAGFSLEQAATYLCQSVAVVSLLESGEAEPGAGVVRALLLEASLRGALRNHSAASTCPDNIALLAPQPSEWADRTGADYVSTVSDEHRKSHGLFLTPVAIAAFSASLISNGSACLRILDPAAGAGILLCAAVETLLDRHNPPRSIALHAYEIDPKLSRILSENLNHLVEWAAKRGTTIAVMIEQQDFVLAHGSVLQSIDDLIANDQPVGGYDVVIANPPYFKLNKSDLRVQAAHSVVCGQPNIYGLFMAVGAALLKPGGQCIYIVPRSFASGPYFRKFRSWFFKNMRPELVHVFGSRRDAFSRDDVLQENVIIKCVREEHWNNDPRMIVSSSAGLKDIGKPALHSVPVSCALDRKSKNVVLRLPATSADDDVLRLVDSWPCTLATLGLQISTGPVVPFRSTEHIDATGEAGNTHAPLLWMNHVRAMDVRWPLGRHKPEFIKVTRESIPILLANRNYVLLRRFSAKEEHRRLVAGPYLARMFKTEFVGLENHLNYLYRPKGDLDEDEAIGLAALLNCELLDTYFRISNGSTQVNATELREMPFPPLEVIVDIGRDVRCSGWTGEQVSDAVLRQLTRFSGKPKRTAFG